MTEGSPADVPAAGWRLKLGIALFALSIALPVIGVNVFHPAAQTLKERIQRLCTELEARHGIHVSEPAIHIEHGYLGAGYGLPGPEQLDAIARVARLEGLLFDPVYSGKALQALMQNVALGHLDGINDVLLIHTGGVAAWGVYDDAVAAAGV